MRILPEKSALNRKLIKESAYIYMLHPISSSYKANQSYTTHNANEKKEKRQLYVKKQDTSLKLNIVKTPSQPM